MNKDLFDQEIESKVDIDFSYNEIKNKIDLSNMKEKNNKFFVLKLNKKLLIVILIFMTLSSVLLVSLFKKSLIYDYALGNIALEKVENAQYAPDYDKYLNVNKDDKVMKNIVKNNNDSDIKDDEFYDIIKNYCEFNGYSGAGKYLGYDIYEIKREIEFVIEKAPAFNQWFIFPHLGVNLGYVEVPYYDKWAYYLEMDEENSALSITRVCRLTRSEYLDFENEKTLEKKGFSIFTRSHSQLEIMKINYYFDDNNDEVVEYYIYNYGIDNCFDFFEGFNSNKKDYHPYEYLYFKNVKDKYLVKYHITVAERYRASDSFDEGGRDLRGLFPYGSIRKFTIVDYEGYDDIKSLDIVQQFETEFYEKKFKIDFEISDELFIKFLENVNINQEEVLNCNNKEVALDLVSKKLVDNFEIANNSYEITKNKYEAIVIEKDKIQGPNYKNKLPIQFLSSYGEFNSDDDILEFSAFCHIKKKNKFVDGSYYCLAPALKSDDGEIIILQTDYKECKKDGKKITMGGVNEHIDIEINGIDFKKIDIPYEGTYRLITVLLRKENDENVIMLDTHSSVLMRGDYGNKVVTYLDAIGNVHLYDIRVIGKELIVNVMINEENVL